MTHENETHIVCPNCKGSFWFPNEGLGMKAPCPHCGTNIELTARATVAPKTAIKSAKKEKTDNYYGNGIESNLEFMAGCIASVGFVGGIILSAYGYFMEGSPKVWPIAGGVITILISLAIKLVFDGFAELLRVLKSIKGLKYSGSIKEPSNESLRFRCSSCRNYVFQDFKQCGVCYATFDEDFKVPQSQT